MITGKTKTMMIAGALFVTGSAVALGLTGQGTGSQQMKHERLASGAGMAGPTGNGEGTGKAGKRGGVAKRPCYAHEGAKKKKCVKVYRENQRRANMTWPPRPTIKEIQSRIGMDQWRKAERVAYCETAGNWQHYPNGSYIGGLGMFRSTYGIGQAVTGYRWVHEGATKQEQIAIGYVVAQRFGWSAWGCGGA